MANFNTLPVQAAPATGDKVFGARGTAVGAEQSTSLALIQTLFETAYDARYGAIAGSSSIVTVGTVATGVWNGTTIAVANGGTGSTTATGTGVTVLATSPTLVTPALGTPASGTLTHCTGLPAAGVTGLAAVATSGSKSDVGLGNVQNTALSTWAGSSNITAVGNLSTTDAMWNMHFSNTNNAFGFYRDSTVEGYINVSTGGTAYVTSSDARLKSPLRPWSLGDKFDEIPVGEFTWLATGETGHGTIAQELHKIYPDAVTVGGDDVNMQPWGVDYGKLTTLLIAEVQALRKRVAVLEAK